MDLRDLLSHAARERADAPKISHAGQIARLREFADRLTIPCPFRPGDLVTPIKGRNVKGAGEPHLVIEVMAPFDRAGVDVTSHAYAQVSDMKVACIMSDTEVLFYNFSGDFEPYAGEAA